MIRRGLRRLRSAVWLLLLLAGLPTALIRYVGWPLPDHWPRAQEWNQWVAEPLTRPVVVDVIALGVWLLWAVLLYAVILDVAARLRRTMHGRGRLRLPPLPATIRATAQGVLGAAVFGTATAAAATAPLSQPPVTPAAATHQPRALDVHSTAGPEAAAGHDARSDADRVVLPDGGWITHHTAAAVAASATVVWRHAAAATFPAHPVASTARTRT